jgi:thioredoxin 1
MSITTITTDNFEEEILKSDKTALVDFYADWCGPCQMMSPIIDEISEELTDVKFGKVNIDDYPEIAANYGIMSIPTLLIFKNGELNNTFVGVTAKDKILDALK